MPLLILHGLGGNEPEHWQTWLANQAGRMGVNVLYPDLPMPHAPSVEVWSQAVRPLLDRHVGDPVAVAAHSLGCHLWAHLAGSSPHRLAERVLLVAPPGEAEVRRDIPSFVPSPLVRRLLVTCPDTAVVLGEGDPWLADPQPLLESGLPVWRVPDGRHLNVEAGYGPWPEVLRWVFTGEPPGVPWRR